MIHGTEKESREKKRRKQSGVSLDEDLVWRAKEAATKKRMHLYEYFEAAIREKLDRESQ